VQDAHTKKKRILFICDAHLGSGINEQEKEEVLVEFIKNLSPESVTTLYVLGDLFDFWFEYESVILSRYFRILTTLAEAVQRGIDIHLVVGNHDFWAGDFLTKTIGLKVHRDPIEIELGGRRVYLCHGDGVNPYDRGYRVLKVLLRNSAVIWLARWVHPDMLMRLAHRFSRYSREASSVAGKLREDEGILRFAQKKLGEGIDIVIAGHSHRPHEERYSIDGAVRYYYNPGDMQERFSYLEYSDGKFHLKYIGREEEPPQTRTGGRFTHGGAHTSS